MRDRASRLNALMLSPAVSVMFAIAGLVLIAAVPWGWISGLPVAGAGLILSLQVKARALYRGPNFPVLGLLMMLQAAAVPDIGGGFVALFTACALTVMFLCFSRPAETRGFFLIYLICGLGALWIRQFLPLAAALMLAQILLRAFSMRGLVAMLLGLVSPLIILAGFGLYSVEQLAVLYGSPWVVGLPLPAVFACSLGLMSSAVMFLPSYGYPAKARARNMAVLGLTGLMSLMPLVDSANYAGYLAVVNLGAAYNVSHFAATRRQGWIAAALVVAAAITFYCLGI